MAITPHTYHDDCNVQIVFGRSQFHYAHLECCDTNCTRKKKFIQWINADTADQIRSQGVPVITDRHYGHKLIDPFKEWGI